VTGNLFIDSAISLSAIALMVAAAWIAFRQPPVPVDEKQARERLAFDEPDFSPARWLLDREGRAALAEGVDGDFALVFRVGVDLVTRRFPAGNGVAKLQGGALVVRPADPGAISVALKGDGAADWARKITGA